MAFTLEFILDIYHVFICSFSPLSGRHLLSEENELFQKHFPFYEFSKIHTDIPQISEKQEFSSNLFLYLFLRST